MKYFKIKYILIGIVMGIPLIVAFWTSLPDGNLHITFCDVGQGDATYIQFPDGRDMLIDGGPDNRVLSCLGAVMPFWDRTIDIVLLTHPEKDHFGGLIEVVKRYQPHYFLSSGSENPAPEYQALLHTLSSHPVQVKNIRTGDQMTEGSVLLSFLWPEVDIDTRARGSYNDQSLVFILRYGSFSAFFPGDAGAGVSSRYVGTPLPDTEIDVLKVPHHGSSTGMTERLVSWLMPRLAVISVGKNNPYHHPSPQSLSLLGTAHVRILRTDQNGIITVASNGKGWNVHGQTQ